MAKFDFEECTEVTKGVSVCKSEEKKPQKKEKDLGFSGDFAKAVYITTRPAITIEEAKFIEESFSSIFVGSIISGLSIAIGFYMYFLISEFNLIVIPDPTLNAVFIVLILISSLAVLAFVQYRITKALSSTKLLERFAVGDNGELESTMQSTEEDVEKSANLQEFVEES